MKYVLLRPYFQTAYYPDEVLLCELKKNNSDTCFIVNSMIPFNKTSCKVLLTESSWKMGWL